MELLGENLKIDANELLEDMFENILTNSIKYNKSDKIEIKIDISKERREMRDFIRMQFRDNGIGIIDSRKQDIFLRSHNENSSVHGLGVGLSLVKKIIENYKGEIWVEDNVKGDVSKGCMFIIRLPEEHNNG